MLHIKIYQNGLQGKVSCERGALLSRVLSEQGFFVPHPCGGRGSCKKCRVSVNGVEVLACRHLLDSDATVVLPSIEQVRSETGGDDSHRLTERVCLCLDIGTTTLALALVSLDDKRRIRTVTSANPQRVVGSDVISRIDYCRKYGVEDLQRVVLTAVNEMIFGLCSEYGLKSVPTLYVSGNTTMLHLFFGVDCSSLGVSPYTPAFLEQKRIAGKDLGISLVEQIVSLSGISAFVGSDIVAGIHFVGFPSSGYYNLLIDLGTNAEIALFNDKTVLCTAAAAGPCFEGANISCGMSAVDGAIFSYASAEEYSVIGGGVPKGICATGLIDLIAYLVRRGIVNERGCLEDDFFPVAGDVALEGRDVREFQLAKSAVRSALECLMRQGGVSFDCIEHVYVAGGFSAEINRDNAAFVGLFPEEVISKIVPVNNASLQGTVRYALDEASDPSWASSAQYVDVSRDPLFSELFFKYMSF